MADLSIVRKRFLQNPHTIKNVRHDFPEWHQGRSRYALWAIDVNFSAVRQQVLTAAQHLSGLLLDKYCRQPHVTLGISGFLSDQLQRADDYTFSNFEADLSALTSAHIQPFEIEIGALSSFSSAPFLHVHDPGNHLHLLHQLLHSVTDDTHTQYVPHVTVGLYSGSWATEMVSNRLDTFPQDYLTRCSISRISLMSYTASEIGGKLATIADYDLERAVIEWQQPSPFMLNKFSDN